MPQLLQVLKCFKCGVFQVHQTKKTIKWECKICGEKQSIKRHYGLGTGKECRLHVQKLNSIRGEVDEINETTKLNVDIDDEEPIDVDSNGPHKKEDHRSKWADFVDDKSDTKEPEPNEAMYIGNDEVVLEIPSKRRKFNNPKNTKVLNIPCETISEFRRSPSPPPIMIYETQEHSVQELKMKQGDSKDYLIKAKDVEQKIFGKHKLGKMFVPPKVDKNSKWAQYANESAEDDCEDELSLQYNEDSLINKVKLKNDVYQSYNLPNTLFSLCNESDLDDVLGL